MPHPTPNKRLAKKKLQRIVHEAIAAERTDEERDILLKEFLPQNSKQRAKAEQGKLDFRLAEGQALLTAAEQAKFGVTDLELFQRIGVRTTSQRARKLQTAIGLVKGRRGLDERERMTDERFDLIVEQYGLENANNALNQFTTISKDVNRFEQSASITQVTNAAALIKGGRSPEEARIAVLGALADQDARRADNKRSTQVVAKATQRSRALEFASPQFDGSNAGLFAPAHVARRKLQGVGFFERGGY